jgi:hypothetical protein
MAQIHREEASFEQKAYELHEQNLALQVLAFSCASHGSFVSLESVGEVASIVTVCTLNRVAGQVEPMRAAAGSSGVCTASARVRLRLPAPRACCAPRAVCVWHARSAITRCHFRLGALTGEHALAPRVATLTTLTT